MRRSAASSSSTSSSSSAARVAASAGGHAEQPRLQDEQLAPGLARVEPGLLQRDADPVGARRPGRRPRRRPRRARVPDVIDSSVVSIFTVVDLPAPFGPEEPEDLAGRDAQIDAAHGLDDAGSCPGSA